MSSCSQPALSACLLIHFHFVQHSAARCCLSSTDFPGTRRREPATRVSAFGRGFKSRETLRPPPGQKGAKQPQGSIASMRDAQRVWGEARIASFLRRLSAVECEPTHARRFVVPGHRQNGRRSLLRQNCECTNSRSDAFHALSTHRELRRRRRHANRGPGGHGRFDRLVLLPPIRLAERLWRHPRRQKGRPIPNYPQLPNHPAEAALLARDERSDHPLSLERRRR